MEHTKQSFQDLIVEQCMDVLQRKTVKDEIKRLFMPIVDAILADIYPYIYLSMIFVFVSFLLTLVIFIIVVKDNLKVGKLFDKSG
jgi:hypothetical protein